MIRPKGYTLVARVDLGYMVVKVNLNARKSNRCEKCPFDISLLIPVALAVFLVIGLFSIKGLAGEDDSFEGSMDGSTDAPFAFPTFNGTTPNSPFGGVDESTPSETIDDSLTPGLVQGDEPGVPADEEVAPEPEPEPEPELKFVMEYQNLLAKYNQILGLLAPYENLLKQTIELKKTLRLSPARAQAQSHSVRQNFEQLNSLDLDTRFIIGQKSSLESEIESFLEKYKEESSQEFLKVRARSLQIVGLLKNIELRPEAILQYVDLEVNNGFANVHPTSVDVIERLNSEQMQSELSIVSLELIYHIGRFTKIALIEFGKGTKTVVDSVSATMVSFYAAMANGQSESQSMKERLRSWLNCMLLVDGANAETCTPDVNLNQN